MANSARPCPDCDASSESVSRREFLRAAGTAGAAAAALTGTPSWLHAEEAAATSASAAAAGDPESIVKHLYETLSDQQKTKICFPWDYTDKRGLLRTRVENNWQITGPNLNSDFYSKDQQALVKQIFEGIIQPDWHKRIYKQLEDDAGGFGNDQSFAIFGQPGSDKFEFVMTGRHMTLRCDGNTTPNVAFGGPLFYGHAASGFNEKPNHPGNVFWHQALAANKVYEMLDANQRKAALVDRLPHESQIAFRGQETRPGLAVSAMSSDQQALVQEVLQKLIEPYRQSDRDEALACLKAQGGLEQCSLAFYREGDLGGDQVWDCWRLEGPSLVWYYRGAPHVHVWVNIADNPAVSTNARG